MPKNVNQAHRDSLTIHERIGVWITNHVGTMWAAYAFCLLAFISLPAALASHDPLIIVAWLAQTFLQLVLLPIIIVGQNVAGRHAELIAENDYEVDLAAERELRDIHAKLDTLMLKVDQLGNNHSYGSQLRRQPRRDAPRNRAHAARTLGRRDDGRR